MAIPVKVMEVSRNEDVWKWPCIYVWASNARVQRESLDSAATVPPEPWSLTYVLHVIESNV